MAHIILIGLRASGKTTIARQLAEQLDRPCVDLDDRVRDALGTPTIQHAWESVGEPGFRDAEAAALTQALAESPSILALGGGTPSAPGASDALRLAQQQGNAIVFYLCAPPDVLRQRLNTSVGSSDPQRPSLTGKGLLEELDDVFDQRDPLYRALADCVLDATQPTHSITQQILDQLPDSVV
jgi:shikimate kinase